MKITEKEDSIMITCNEDDGKCETWKNVRLSDYSVIKWGYVDPKWYILKFAMIYMSSLIFYDLKWPWPMNFTMFYLYENVVMKFLQDLVDFLYFSIN